MGVEYRISFGFQYEAWEVKIHLPETVCFQTETEAHVDTAGRNPFAFVTSENIFMIEKGRVEEITASEQDLYEFSVLKDEVYERLGRPLSPEDIDQLIEEKQLEEIIFSSQYIVNENDFQIRTEDLPVIFKEIRQHNDPVKISALEAYPNMAGQKGFLFESLWYALERIR